jgi:hypothetical protein
MEKILIALSLILIIAIIGCAVLNKKQNASHTAYGKEEKIQVGCLSHIHYAL